MWIAAIPVVAPPASVQFVYRPELGDKQVVEQTFRYSEAGAVDSMILSERVEWLLQQRDSKGSTVGRLLSRATRMVVDGQVIRPKANVAANEYFERRDRSGRLLRLDADPNFGELPSRFARLVTPVYPSRQLRVRDSFEVRYEKSELPGTQAKWTFTRWDPADAPRRATFRVDAEELTGEERMRMTATVVIDLGNGVTRSLEATAKNAPVLGAEDDAKGDLRWSIRFVTQTMRAQRPLFGGKPAR
jgi:hypothetical protein